MNSTLKVFLYFERNLVRYLNLYRHLCKSLQQLLPKCTKYSLNNNYSSKFIQFPIRSDRNTPHNNNCSLHSLSLSLSFSKSKKQEQQQALGTLETIKAEIPVPANRRIRADQRFGEIKRSRATTDLHKFQRPVNCLRSGVKSKPLCCINVSPIVPRIGALNSGYSGGSEGASGYSSDVYASLKA